VVGMCVELLNVFYLAIPVLFWCQKSVMKPSVIKNQCYKILEGCNNTGGKNPVMFIWSYNLAVIRIREENKVQRPETI